MDFAAAENKLDVERKQTVTTVIQVLMEQKGSFLSLTGPRTGMLHRGLFPVLQDFSFAVWQGVC